MTPTPTESEKQAALAWADTRWDHEPMSHVHVLAAAVRSRDAELKLLNEHIKYRNEQDFEKDAEVARLTRRVNEMVAEVNESDDNFTKADAENAGMRSRLKTLEEENARMRSNYSMECYDHGHGYPCHICSAPTALKQEAE